LRPCGQWAASILPFGLILCGSSPAIKPETDKIMNKSQKALLVTAALAGLVGGVMAQAKMNAPDRQNQSVAGKPAPANDTIKMSCNGCGGKTNKVTIN